MRKKFYLLLLAACTSTITFAQVQKVQGVPRKAAKSVTASTAADIYPNIDFEKLRFISGEGRNISALIVKWDDGKGGNKNLVWGYRWNSVATDGTGVAMLKAIAKTDPRFYLLVKDGTQYGTAIGGIGYDLNGNGNIGLMRNDTLFQLTDGVYNTTAYDFDKWTSNDASDHWRAGWMNGYWSYWTTNALTKPFEYSSVGASSRELSNQSIDGWSYLSDMSNWYSADMSGEVEYVTEPLSSTGNIKAVSGEAVKNKSHQVNSVAELRSTMASDDFVDGDTIKFRPGLKGTVLTNDNPDYGYTITKSVVVDGSGVIIGPGWGYACFSEKNITFKNITFSGIKECAFYINNSSLNVENCLFDKCESTTEGSAIHFESQRAKAAMNLNIAGCTFSKNKNGNSTVYIKSLSSENEKVMTHAKIVSSTFADNENSKGSEINIVNYPEVQFANNVFAGNTDGKEDGKTISVSTEDVPEGRVKSLGYNVIEGGITAAYKNIITSTDNVNEQFDKVLQLQDNQYQVVKDGPAYNNLPANTTFEGMTLPEKDITGMLIDYAKPTNSGACQLVYEGEIKVVDYSKGTFIVNEDWYGHQNSTLNFLTDDGEWIYRVIQKENPGVELGCTNQYGAIYGEKFYLIAKQDKDPGATIQGARITIADAKTLKVEKQIPVIASDDKGSSIADGRGFLGVDSHKGYVGSSNGIYVLDLDNQKITGYVKGSENIGGSGYNQLYSGQVGTMVRVNDRVFAIHQAKGLLVINPETDRIDETLSDVNGYGFGSVVLSKDGNLWVSLVSNGGSDVLGNRLLKVDPATLDTAYVACPEGIYGPASSWYAWTPDCFCASTQHNVLYWNGGASSWFSNATIYKYDIDKNEFSTFIDFTNDPDKWKIYGCSFRISPVTDEAYVSLFHTFGDPTYVLRRYDNNGTMLSEYPMISNYWFPSLPVFPDNEGPVVNTSETDIEIGMTPAEISLANLATDADNMDAAIIKSIKNISDKSVLSATMDNGNLVLLPRKKGDCRIVISINSNGKLAEAELHVTVGENTGINNTYTNAVGTVDAYTLDGRRVNTATKGLRIIRKADGTVQKVVVK